MNTFPTVPNYGYPVQGPCTLLYDRTSIHGPATLLSLHSQEEHEDAQYFVESALMHGIADIQDMLRRKSSKLVLSENQRALINRALDILNAIEVK